MRNNQQQSVGVIAIAVTGYDATGAIASVSFGSLDAELAVLALDETRTYHTLPVIPTYATSIYTYTVQAEGIAEWCLSPPEKEQSIEDYTRHGHSRITTALPPHT